MKFATLMMCFRLKMFRFDLTQHRDKECTFLVLAILVYGLSYAFLINSIGKYQYPAGYSSYGDIDLSKPYQDLSKPDFDCG